METDRTSKARARDTDAGAERGVDGAVDRRVHTRSVATAAAPVRSHLGRVRPAVRARVHDCAEQARVSPQAVADRTLARRAGAAVAARRSHRADGPVGT